MRVLRRGVLLIGVPSAASSPDRLSLLEATVSLERQTN